MRSHNRLKSFFFMSVAALFILTVATTEIASSQGLSASAWPCKGYDIGRTGQSASVGAQVVNVPKWNYKTMNKVHSSPAIGTDGTIYVGSMDNKLYAIMPDGKLLWSYQVGDKIYSSPAIGADGTIYVGSCDGKIYALNPDGSLKWVSQAGWDIDSSPVIGMDGTIYIGSHDGRLYALNPQDGSIRWDFQIAPLYMYSSPAIGAEGTVFVAGSDGQVYAIGSDGGMKWNCQVDEGNASPVLVGLAIGSDATIYVGSYSGKIYALWPDGNLKWSYKTGDQVHSSPAIAHDGTVYVGSHDRMIYALKPDGTLKWKYSTGGAVYSSPAIGADGTVYVGSLDGSIYALRPDGRLVWKYGTRGQIYSSPAIAVDGTLYIGSYDYRLYAFGAVACLADDQCPSGSFCQRGVGDCQGLGVCSVIPQTCPNVADPVCDCDDQTQSNWCQAAANSVSVAYPGACGATQPQPEVCDGVDNDNNGQTDEGLTRPCSTLCGSGEETCQNGQWVGCSAPQPQTEVCDGKDNDCNGQTDENLTEPCSTLCGQGVKTCQDGQWVGCTAPQPQTEVCDGQDNDCNGLPDDNLTRTCADGSGTETCQDGQWVGCSTPQQEICDGIDNNNNGKTDEDLVRPCTTLCGAGEETCQNGQWVGCTAPQPQTEVCDGEDNDCNGQTDENLTRPCTTLCGSGEETCRDGQWVECSAPQPQTEVCDGEDNDCNGSTDEGLTNTYYADSDGDGYGNPSVSIQACFASSGYVTDKTDCDDTDLNIHPGALEIPCNGKDDDCVGGDNTATCGSNVYVEDDSGSLDIEGVKVEAGEVISIPIRIQSAPDAINNFAFEVIYDPGTLKFLENFVPGDLAGSFNPFEVTSLAPGRIKVSGSSSTGGIPKGASGYLSWLKFESIGSQGAGKNYSLQLENLSNDLAGFSKSGGVLNVFICNGDLDGDGSITDADVQIVFKCYLSIGPCPDCTDVNKDGKVSPTDSKCLIYKSSGQPSCLD